MWQVLLPLLKASIAELADLDLPMFGAARHWAIASIQKTYAGQARKVAHALWGLRPPLFAKITVLVDADVDVHDVSGVLEAIATHVDPGRDVLVAHGPADPLDVATRAGAVGPAHGDRRHGEVSGRAGGLLAGRRESLGRDRAAGERALGAIPIGSGAEGR